MKIESLKAAQLNLIEAHVDLEESIEDISQSSEDEIYQQILQKKQSLETMIGSLAVSIASLQRKND